MMGVFKRTSWSKSYISDSRNPDPNKFKVIRELEVNNFFISEVYYPNCTNYEGRKILVTKKSISNVKCLDPHFTKDSDLIARFVPDEYGWKCATLLVKGMSK